MDTNFCSSRVGWLLIFLIFTVLGTENLVLASDGTAMKEGAARSLRVRTDDYGIAESNSRHQPPKQKPKGSGGGGRNRRIRPAS